MKFYPRWSTIFVMLVFVPVKNPVLHSIPFSGPHHMVEIQWAGQTLRSITGRHGPKGDYPPPLTCFPRHIDILTISYWLSSQLIQHVRILTLQTTTSFPGPPGDIVTQCLSPKSGMPVLSRCNSAWLHLPAALLTLHHVFIHKPLTRLTFYPVWYGVHWCN